MSLGEFVRRGSERQLTDGRNRYYFAGLAGLAIVFPLLAGIILSVRISLFTTTSSSPLL